MMVSRVPLRTRVQDLVTRAARRQKAPAKERRRGRPVGQGKCRQSRALYSASLAALAAQFYGGEWAISVDPLDRKVSLHRVDGDVDVPLDEVRRQCLEICRARRFLRLSRAQTRAWVGRQVPWSCVEKTWQMLKGPKAVQPVCTRVGNAGLSMAYVDPVAKILDLLQCLEPGWQQVDCPCYGELWVRWGIDGVPVWSTSREV